MSPVLRRLTEFLHRRRLYGAAGLAASALLSLRHGRRSWVHWDGEDWILSSGDMKAVHTSPTFNLERTLSDIDLFCFDYVPRAGDVIVIVGAENGDELPFFCRRAGPNGRVYAFEPDPGCFRRLVKLKAVNHLLNLTIIQAAVSGEAGEVLFTQGSDTQTNQIVTDGSSGLPSISVKAVTLEDALPGESRIDYLKLNVEGAEAAILAPLPGRLVIEALCVSCHDFKSPEYRTYDAVRLWLQQHGYAIRTYARSDGLPEQRFWRNYYVFGRKLRPGGRDQAQAPSGEGW
jgi:FkbM family methyltransferase